MPTNKDEPKDEAPATLTAAVAPRNSVVVPVNDKDGKMVARKRHGPGELVTVDAEEAKLLIARGVLLAPNSSGPIIAAATGPSFEPTTKQVIRPQ